MQGDVGKDNAAVLVAAMRYRLIGPCPGDKVIHMHKTISTVGTLLKAGDGIAFVNWNDNFMCSWHSLQFLEPYLGPAEDRTTE